MRKKTWTSITAASSGLDDGCYVLTITNVADVTNDADEGKHHLLITWDVAEGPSAGHYGDEWGTKNEWAHQFKVWYNGKSEPFFKYFLECLEQSNPSFSIAQWEQTANEYALIGKKIGASWGTRQYTYNGDDKKQRTNPLWWTVDDVRNGKATKPKDVDDREGAKAEQQKPAKTKTVIDQYGGVREEPVDDDEIPF